MDVEAAECSPGVTDLERNLPEFIQHTKNLQDWDLENGEGGGACPFQVAHPRSRKRRHVIWGTAALGFIPKMIGVLRIPRTRVAQLATLFQLARMV